MHPGRATGFAAGEEPPPNLTLTHYRRPRYVTVIDVIRNQIMRLPEHLRKTLTWDSQTDWAGG